ncbi:rhodanese-like domain-containing protein [Pseudoroseicyclus aestuarii]|uniref:Rhodanese-related sulfurtransferase n=1 Tax=Pseudoroseicyclus aestuarii TaxID=1795041 RepID=A0A318STN7_9RHOB|nr:rhodanese-like domain-containing protein [Pseudoroseicyclus aestuarii]PYE83739.1 rhodanese-related sulfurtransferase [Pseudoroseicyclus aestuarii]
MGMTLKDLVAEARTQVGTIEPAEAQADASAGGLILDVREPSELAQNGAVAGALNLPRGILETRADATLDTAEPRLTGQQGKGTVHVLCAAGGRAALAAATLRRMGYEADVIAGGLNGWKAADLPVEMPG